MSENQKVEPVVTSEQLLKFESPEQALDSVIAVLEFMKEMIPSKADDLLLSFLKWGRNEPLVLDLLRKATPPQENALVSPPPELDEALRLWSVSSEDGVQHAIDLATWTLIAQSVMQIMAAIAKRRAAKNQG